MATAPSTFSCRLADSHCLLPKHPFPPVYTSSAPSSSTLGRTKYPKHNIHGRHSSKRLVLVTALQSSFLKNFNLGFNEKNENDDDGDEDEDEDEDSEGPKFNFDFGPFSNSKGSNIILRNQFNPLSLGKLRQQDPSTVFVAGATGQFGARISQKLLRQGFSVRAAVSDLSFAQELAQFATQYKIISAEDAKRLNAVEFSFEDIESTAKAIGNASKAVVSIGPTEDGPSSKVTTTDALNVIEAAKLANVNHVVVVYESDGASSNVLDGISSFFSNLFGKPEISLSELTERIVEMGLSYTILKASSTDDFISEKDCNLVLKAEGSADVNNKVSKTQVASVVAEVFANTSISENKTIDVAASPSAPSLPVYELLSAIPTDGRKEAFAEAQAKAKAEEEERIAAENVRKKQELAEQLEAEAKRLAEKEAEATELAAQVKAGVATASFDYFASKAKEFGVDIFGGSKGTQIITSSNSQSRKSLETPVVTVKGEEKYATSQPKKVFSSVFKLPAIKKKTGGVFKQETIYVDDD